jgi:NAD(P)-dependent dehydrogenase (short-subunit alcohol dehydrogenase family)
MHRFAGRTIVLTGVGREGQVGEAVARAFAEEGASLTLVDRDPDEAQARARTLRAAGHDAHPEQCDLADPEQVAALAVTVATRHGGVVHALVNVAGGFAMSGPVADSDVAVWHRQIDINLTTAYLATRAFLPLLRPQRGSIVYFASAAALPGEKVAGMGAYVAAKSGVAALTRTVAEEERASGVRANAVAPTAVRTAANLGSMGAEIRYVEREEVARTVLFLCSDDASAVTGQILRLS